MKIDFNLDKTHFKITCDKCDKVFSDDQINKKETFCRCPYCDNFICGMGYLVTKERKDYMKYGKIAIKSSGNIKRKYMPKKKLVKRTIRNG